MKPVTYIAEKIDFLTFYGNDAYKIHIKLS